ncbi:MAG: lipid-A-disaccharide synthase, partial [Oceanobacter sp.]
MRIAIVAGETSGDMLGSGLLTELKQLYPTATFEGIGGPMMQARGLHSHFPMERLSVMGLIEVLGRLFELLSIRKSLIQRWTDDPPDLFIGIDAPDFNLTLEEKLKERGIKTVHYVSPSVWAWRQKRVFKVARAVDLMLTLFPFEARFYERHKVAVRCVGHHLADKIPMQTPFAPARKELGFSEMDSVICLMPGSRGGEVERLGPLFLETAQWLLRRRPEYRFVIPAASVDRRNQLEEQLSDLPFELPVEIVLGKSRTCIAASNAVLVASGTATLEVMLLKRPMVVSYKV